MKIMIGDKVHCATKELVIVFLTPQDRKNISKMPEDYSVYAMFPDSWDIEDVKRKMRKIKEGEKKV